MNISSDIVNDSHIMHSVINNNKFKKLTWSYHKKGNNEITECHDDSSNIISVKFSDYEGHPRFYFSAKKYIDNFDFKFRPHSIYIGNFVYKNAEKFSQITKFGDSIFFKE